MKIIEFILIFIAKSRIKKAWRQILLGAGIVWLIIKAIEWYYINPWYIWGPIIGIIILSIIIIRLCVKAYNDGF